MFQAVEVKEALKQLCLTGDPDSLSAVLLNLEEEEDNVLLNLEEEEEEDNVLVKMEEEEEEDNVLLNLDEDEKEDNAHTGYVQPKCEEGSSVNQKQKCPHCGKIIVKRENMQKHISAKHPIVREYMCNECPFSSAHKAQLKKHINSMHTRSSFACSQCDQECNTKNNLDWHTRTKHEDTKPSCDTLNR